MKTFAEKILAWYDREKRELPWRNTRNPYYIWLSEVIMQQTQIVQGLSYYNKFIETYPTVNDLAAANEQDVLLLWQGLGYYSRVRNLHFTAKYIAHELGSKFPVTFKELLKLKGVGEYTAAAIASICYDERQAAVDGNVLRVIARVFGLNKPINSTAGKKEVKELSDKFISETRPGDYNQAMMDFGATQCTPKNPSCESCIFKKDCLAYQQNKVSVIPVKTKAKAKVDEYFHYFVIISDTQIILHRRTSGIWKNMYDFPAIVSGKKVNLTKLKTEFSKQFFDTDFLEVGEEIKHVLSHRNLYIRFFATAADDKIIAKVISNDADMETVKLVDIKKYPMPIVIANFIDSFDFMQLVND